jgi:hypothetical protein
MGSQMMIDGVLLRCVVHLCLRGLEIREGIIHRPAEEVHQVVVCGSFHRRACMTFPATLGEDEMAAMVAGGKAPVEVLTGDARCMRQTHLANGK